MAKIGQIQKVNPNPRPPNEPKGAISNNFQPSKKGLASAQPAKAGAKTGIGVSNNQVANKPGPGNNAANTSTPGPVAAPAPAAPVDPRDSTYWEEIAQINLNRTAGMNRLEEAGVLADTSLKRQTGVFDYNDPLENMRLRENANVAGGIYSTRTREDEGNLAQEQYARRAGLKEDFDRSSLERAKEKDLLSKEYGTGLNGNYGQLGIVSLKEAVARRIQELMDS